MHAKQLVWRCRRGVRELDVLFGRYLEEEYDSLSAAQKAGFEKLLDQQDPVIMDWLFDRSQPSDPDLIEHVARLKEIAGLA